MKKFLCILTVMLLTFSAAACTQEPAPNTETPAATAGAETTRPAPTEEVLGTMQADVLSNLDESVFQEVHRFVIDTEGENIALYNDGLLTDVSVEWGTMDPEGTAFMADHVVWTADRMEPDTLLVVTAWLSDVVPNLCIRYTGAEGETVQTVFQSGKDGSMLLYPEK